MDIYQLFRVAFKASIAAGEAIMKVYESDDFDIQNKSDNSPLTKADMAAHHIIKQHLETTPFPILSEEDADIPFSEREKWDTFWLVDPLDGTKEFINKNGDFTVNIALIQKGIPIMGFVYLPVEEVLYWGEKEQGSFRFAFTEKQKLIITTRAFEDLAFMVYIIAHSWVLPYAETETYTVVGSRSHKNEETQKYIEQRKKQYPDLNMVDRGSSLKICMVAEGKADEYPRLAPTMEWDTAAGQAVAMYAGCHFTKTDLTTPVIYNKKDLTNPHFVVKR